MGVTEEELKQYWERDGLSGREAAFEDLVNEELCCDLAGQYARESARKTADAIADVRDRYEAIALGFRCARGAQFSEVPLALGNALNALAKEFERDRKGLLRFLDAVFKRWQKIDQPDSLWRQQLVTQQHGSRNRKKIGDHLETIGSANDTESLRLRIGQYLTRDQKSALQRRGL